MALQTSGTISINDIATEFGGTAPHSLNEYYRGGGLVPDTAANAAIPTSGQVSLDDFYGGSVVSGAQPGKLWVWGANSIKGLVYGNLGRNESTDARYSSPVQVLGGASNWTSVAQNGVGSSYGTKSDGRLWCWGVGNSGQLGTNDRVGRSSPIQTVAGGTDWETKRTALNATNSVAHAIKTDGRMWGWGYNQVYSSGAVGDNTTIPRSSPVQVLGSSTNWDVVLGGWGGIKTDGRLWNWGPNFQGGLGTNDTIARSSPIQTVAGGTNWVDGGICDYSYLVEPYLHTAIKSDGKLWSWGRNWEGQLGTNDAISRSSPVQTVAGGTNWASCTLSAAIKTDGRLWNWGKNQFGQLSVGDSVQRSSPVQTVAGGTNWAYVISGYGNFSAIKTDGRMWGWGANSLGQLGTNDTSLRSSPIQTVAGGTSWQTSSIFGDSSGGATFGIKT